MYYIDPINAPLKSHCKILLSYLETSLIPLLMYKVNVHMKICVKLVECKLPSFSYSLSTSAQSLIFCKISLNIRIEFVAK